MRTIQYMRPRVDTNGEGSRGGKIIGHPSSGKPIYMNHNHPTHKEFSSSDHRDAVKLHFSEGFRVQHNPASGELSKSERDVVKQHNEARKHHDKEFENKRGR